MLHFCGRLGRFPTLSQTHLHHTTRGRQWCIFNFFVLKLLASTLSARIVLTVLKDQTLRHTHSGTRTQAQALRHTHTLKGMGVFAFQLLFPSNTMHQETALFSAWCLRSDWRSAVHWLPLSAWRGNSRPLFTGQLCVLAPQADQVPPCPCACLILSPWQPR